MSSAPTREEMVRDATWLAHALDPSAGMVRLVAMSRESYRAAGFLDDRLLQSPVDSHVVPWPDIEAAFSVNLRNDARWIFHIGHVGSTLLSRLLGELPNVLAIREPRFLRDLAISRPEVRHSYVELTAKLMSRTFSPEQVACVKATSFVSEIAAQLIPPGGRSLFLHASPRNYIASILAGENSLKELHLLDQGRRQRLASHQITLGDGDNDAGKAAAAWACEMTSLEAAASAVDDERVVWVDFDRALDDMANNLSGIARFFGFEVTEHQLTSLATGPLMYRYSKALEYEYSPRLRSDLIDDALLRNSGDVDQALAMLNRAAEQSPLLASALQRSRREG